MDIPDWAKTGAWDFIEKTAPTLLGVLLGGVLVRKYWMKRENKSLLIDYLIKELDDLRDDAVSYWALEYQDDKAEANRARKEGKHLEQKIKASLKNLTPSLRAYSEKYCGGRKDFTQKLAVLNDACTSGKFEEAKRPADPDRYLHIVNSLHDVRWELFSHRP